MTRQSRTSYVINHSHGFGWAKTCITPHFSSQISSRLLFRAHTSYQSLSVLEWSTDISLTVEPRRRYDSHRLLTTPISARLKGKKRKNTSGSIAAFPAVNYHQLFVGKQSAPDLTMSVEHRDGAKNGGFSLRSCWVSCTLDPVFLFCPGHCRHPINANMLKYTLTQSPSPPYPHIFLHLCLPLTWGPVKAGDRQSCTSVRYQTGNRAYCTPTILTAFFLKACVCLANVRIHSNLKQSPYDHRENVHTPWKVY